ncbi:hypothetical protein ABK040_008410 [Willaertia magna]
MSCLRMVCFGDNQHHQLAIALPEYNKKRIPILSTASNRLEANSTNVFNETNSFLDLYNLEYAKSKVHFINTTSTFYYQTIKKVICGCFRTFFITDSHKVYCCGNNDFNNLPVRSNFNKSFIEKPTFSDLLQHEDIIDISCGYFYNIFISRRPLVFYAIGNNSFGQCSLGSNLLLKSLNDVYLLDVSKLKNTSKECLQLSCGTTHSLLLTNDNRVYVCGSPDSGKLGITVNNNAGGAGAGAGANNNDEEFITSFTLIDSKHLEGKTVSVQAGSNWSLFLTKDGSLYFCGTSKLFFDTILVPTICQTIQKVDKMVSSLEHAILLVKEEERKKLVGFGRFVEGQLGQKIISNRERIEGTKMQDIPLDNEFIGKVVEIIVGAYHSLIINDSNELYVCGSNLANQLGYFEKEMKELPNSEPIVTKFTKLNRHYLLQDLNSSKNYQMQASCGELHTFVYFTSNQINNVIAQFSMGLTSNSSFDDISFVLTEAIHYPFEEDTKSGPPLKKIKH